ncbi:DUF1499 domain-containing protein [Microbulbifer bruguierae]|uniref:DUF1499 domain-containing protein n=1 Tax=Microbulbifer bruguierae TaxID=3029061 RepID=A0ABY8NEV2_9GAMM|nr:DUF1499 domain-containing protein [Microbulbifer bruguierae]WGL17460.1 DUF1499 domain-containing protein [Microbulbifer bruguierae]
MIRSGRPRHWGRWLYRIQWLLLAVGGLGVAGVRLNLLTLDSALVLFAAVGLAMVAVALVAMLVFLWGLVRRHGEARTAALWAMVLGLVPVALPLFTVGQQNLSAPALYDISTDLKDPPQFDLLVSLRDTGDHSPDYPGAVAADVQRAAPGYADIQPLILPLSVSDTIASSEVVARDMGWRVIAVQPGKGRLEAVARTPVLGITQDVVVRIRPEGAQGAEGPAPGRGDSAGKQRGTRVDIRSASRKGQRDFGSNAARIREFQQRLRAAAGLAQ